MTPRRLLLSIALLVGLIIGVACAVFISTFDINDYRATLEKSLSEALAQPVKLGAGHMAPGFGLAITYDGIVIGDDATEPLLTARQLMFKVRLLSLLALRVDFSHVSLLQPVLRLNTVANSLTNGTGVTLGAQSTLQTLIHSLRIHDGKIIWNGGSAQQPHSVVLDQMNAAVSNLAFDRPIKLQLQTRINSNGDTIPLQAVGKITLPRQADWHQLVTDLEIRAAALPAAMFNQFLPPDITLAADGPFTLRLELDGSPHSGLRTAAQLNAKKPRLILPNQGTLPLAELALAGVWTTGKEQRIDQLRLTTGAAVVAGEIVLSGPADNRYCAGRLSGTIPELNNFQSALQNWLPAEAVDSGALGGQLECSEFSFAGELSAWQGPWRELPIKSAALRLSNLAVPLPDGLSFTAGELSIDFRNDILTFSDGHGRLAKQPLSFSGTVTHPATEGTLDLFLDTTVSSDVLTTLPFNLPAALALSGNIPLTARLGGQLTSPEIRLVADLTPFAVSRDAHPLKRVDEPGRFTATLTATDPERWRGDALLEIPLITLAIDGTRQRGGDQTFQLNIAAPATPVSRFTTLLPELATLRPAGTISGNYRLSGAAGQPTRHAGTLQLNAVGVSLHGVVADISALNGVINITPEQLDGTGLTAVIGASPAAFDLHVADLTAPVIDIDLRVPQIRGDELIFYSPTRTLHDLDARLRISAEHIEFSRVSVRLPAGTSATVTGYADWHDQVKVKLDIAGKWADVDEIIGLWSDPHAPHAALTPTAALPAVPHVQKNHDVFVDIAVKAENGVIKNFTFRDAEARIVWRDNRLIIHPLTFSGDPGFCTGQVIFENHPGARSRLRVSGYGSDFAAATVYERLLQKKAPLSGNMISGFYLDGLLNGTFIDTLNGGVSLRIKDGVLRRFKILSKVFSILNVSQIFQFQLPDMAREGMPFERLDASFKITDGVLHTEDLFIKSNAMNLSLIGDINLANKTLALVMGVKPLRTVDRIITQIPLAGWILTGEEKALITAQFKVTGASDEPTVEAIPITSLSDTVFGIFKRIFGLPAKVVTDVGEFIKQ
ncbi:MAG: AsmA-like C-terminal domain-containing protein [Desulfuromonadales bacterium]|nr:AsmA-like C-terminal domain-containing protein [Desulfuromonadales bacterium]